MSVRPCPRCHATAPRFLGESSDGAVVWHYSCAVCGHYVETLPTRQRPPVGCEDVSKSPRRLANQ